MKTVEQIQEKSKESLCDDHDDEQKNHLKIEGSKGKNNAWYP